MSAFTTPNPITATLTTAGARVRVAASERPDTVVRVEPLDATNSADVKVTERTEVAFTAGELTIKTTKSGAKTGSIAITVELPAGSKLALNTAWTDVVAEGPLGDCELNVGTGRVRLDHVASVRGNLAAGEVSVGQVTGTVELEGGSGGRVDIERAEGSVTARAGNCPIRVGLLTGAKAELVNAAGGIEVGVPPAARVDARSTKGQVRDSGGAQDKSGTTEVFARTRLDDIVIHRVAA